MRRFDKLGTARSSINRHGRQPQLDEWASSARAALISSLSLSFPKAVTLLGLLRPPPQSAVAPSSGASGAYGAVAALGGTVGPDPDEIVEHVFVAQVEGGDPTLSSEHDAWGWHVPEEAASMLKWPNNIEALWRSEAFLTVERGKNCC